MAYDSMQLPSSGGYSQGGTSEDVISQAQKFQQDVAASTGAIPVALQAHPVQEEPVQDGPAQDGLPALSGFAPAPSFQDARAAALQAALTAPSGAAASSQAGGASAQAGPMVTRSYDATSGALLATTTTQADGTSTVLVEGTGQGWTSVLNSYDAAGRMTEQQVQHADRHVDDMVLDPASQQVLGSTSTDGSGHLTQKSEQHPDGTATLTGYDAAGVADKVTTWNADGTSTVLETNTASQPYGWQDWSTTQGTYNAAGILTDEVAHNLDNSTTTSHYDVAHKDALQFQTTRNADGSSMDMVEDTSGTQTYSAYDVYKDAAGHITSQNIFGRLDGSLETTLYDASGAVQSSTTTNADHSSSVVTENADGSVKIDDYTAAGQLADEAVAHADKSVTKTVYQTVNGTATASATYQFNADGSWVENDLDDALAGSPLLVQQVHNANGTETDYVHAPQGGQSYTSYTVQKDKAGTVTEEDIQGTDGSYTQATYAAGKLAKSTKVATDGSYATTYLNTGTQPWAFQTYSFNAQAQLCSAVSYYAAAGGKAAYWTQDNWTPSTQTWTGQSTHYDNGTEYDVVIGGASDSFSFYTVGKDAAGTVRQQSIVNADGSTVVLGSDSAGHVDSRTILPAGGGFDQEVVNASGQTSAIVAHGADGSGIVQAFTTGGAAGTPQTLSYQSLTNAQGQETGALLVAKDGSRTQETYGADGRVLSASVTRADGTLVSGATYGAGGAQTSATVLNADGSRTVTAFDAQGHVQTVSFVHADGTVGASFVVEAGGGVTAGQAVLNQVTVALSEQILAQPADGKHTVSQKVTLPDGELYTVTVDASGKVVAKHEHPNALLGDIEQVVGVALNVLAFVPGVNAVAAPLAVAWDTAQAGEDFSQGNVLGGVLSLGSAVGVGVVGAASGVFGQGVAQGLETLSGATTAVGLGAIGQGILEGTALVGGVSGIVQGIKSGDPLAIAAGGLEVVAAGVSGLVTSGQLDASLGSDASGIAAAKASTVLANDVSLGAGLGSAALGSADAAEHGDWVGSIGGLLAAVASSRSALSEAADDLFGTAAVPAQAAGGQDAPAGYQSAAVQPVSQQDLTPPEPAAAAAAASPAGGGVGAGTGDGGVATGGSGAVGPGGGTAAGTGLLGSGAGHAPDGSQQSGGLPTSNAGVTTDASGMVHVDVAPITTGYAPTGDASTGEYSSGGTTVRLGPTGLEGAPATGVASTNDGSVTGLPGLDGVPGDDGSGGPGSGAGGTSLLGSLSAALPTASAASKMVLGLGEVALGGGSMVVGGAAAAGGLVTAPTGVGVGVMAGGAALVGAGGLVAAQGSATFQQGLDEYFASAPALPSSAPPIVALPAGDAAHAAVNTGDLSAMTGLGASTIPTDRGFTQTPPLPPLPGFSTTNLPLPPFSTPITDTAVPNSTGGTGSTVNPGDWQEGFSGTAAGDGLQGAQIVAATGMGSMTPPRTEGLGDTASMADLVAAGALPGRQGVILTDPASDPAALFGNMYDLTQQTGVEYALTKENGRLVLYSGAPNSVSVPSTAEPIAHTHPDGVETLPSTQDIQILNDIWVNNPAGPRPSSTVIWGSGPKNITTYNATGFDQLTGSK